MLYYKFCQGKYFRKNLSIVNVLILQSGVIEERFASLRQRNQRIEVGGQRSGDQGENQAEDD